MRKTPRWTPFRVAREHTTRRYVAHTMLQSVVVWTLRLVEGPLAIVLVERTLGVPAFHVRAQAIVAVVLFLAFSTLNLATGATLAVRGHGTPLPMASPRALVRTGPYRFVRNPMAIAGLGQGVAVGIWLGSWLTLAYVFAGGVLWHVALRPAEERDLLARFGERYAEYRESVPLWWPRFRR